jgi:hypothetical protein
LTIAGRTTAILVVRKVFDRLHVLGRLPMLGRLHVLG